MFNIHDLKKNQYMLHGRRLKEGYDWWWHSFTAKDEETGEEKPFFIEFYVINPALGGDEAIFGQKEDNKKQGKRPSYLMVKAGWWGKDAVQLHRFFPWKAVTLQKGAPYSVKAEDCLADENTLKGSIHITPEEAKAHPEWMCDSGSISFDLKLKKEIAFNVGYGASALFRFIHAFQMYWHAEGMKTSYEGTIVANGRRYLVDKASSYGYADKNWGSGFTTPWVWLSSNCLTSSLTGKKLENSVFDIGGGKPKVFGIPLDRKLLGAFYYEGREFDYNFSHFWKNVHTAFSFQETEDEVCWHVEQSNWNSRMVTDITCKKEDMILVNYEDPRGQKRHTRLWNGGNGVGRIQLFEKKRGKESLLDDIHLSHAGCEYGEFDS